MSINLNKLVVHCLKVKPRETYKAIRAFLYALGDIMKEVKNEADA